ncbi:unnamed protein product [Calypogeia fissa]
MQRSFSWSRAIISALGSYTSANFSPAFSVVSRAMTSASVPLSTTQGPNGTKASFLTDAAILIEGIKTFLFDLDGVIWKGGKLIDGVPETLTFLRTLGKKLIFVTNNSTKSRKMLHQQFHKMGLEANEEEIFSSSFAAASYLTTINFAANKKVYIVGEEGIQRELQEAGILYLGGPEDGEKKIDTEATKDLDYDPDVGAVVVGFDRNINYYKLTYATVCLKNPGCLFIATNLDSVSNVSETQVWPAGGTMVGAVKVSSGREPTVVGKPSTFMMDYIANKFQISKTEICMVGDRLDTDILFGQNGGCKTLLVLSGVTDLKTLQSPENLIQPDFYTNKVSDLLSAKN